MQDNRIRIQHEYVEEIIKRYPNVSVGRIVNFWIACILYPRLTTDAQGGLLSSGGIEVPKQAIVQIEEDFNNVFESW